MLSPAQTSRGPAGSRVIVLSARTSITTSADVPLQPLASITVTLKRPLLSTRIEGVVSPVDHTTSLKPVTDRVAEPPLQNVAEPSIVISGRGAGLTCTTTVSLEPRHPPAVSTATQMLPGWRT